MIKIFFRKYKNDIFLAVIILFFSVFINYISLRLYNLYYINANTNFNKSCIYFSFSTENDAYIDKDKIFSENINSKTAVYRKFSESGMEFYRTLYSNHDPDIIKGEGFADYDFENDNEYMAVIGVDANKIIDTDKLVIRGKLYSIRGVFRDKKKPSNNYTVYLNDNSKSICLSDVYILDGKNKREINKTFDIISENALKYGAVVKQIVPDNISPEAFIKYQKPVIVIFAFIIAVMIFLNFIISVFWLYSCQREIAVLNLVGKNYFFPVSKRYIIITLSANFIGFAVSTAVMQILEMICINAFSFVCMEIFELISLYLGMFYFSLKNTETLLEIDNE